MQSTFELKRWETEVAQKIVVVQKISKFHNPPIDGFYTCDQKPYCYTSQLKYVFWLEENVSRVIGQNFMMP